jgi:ubiquinone/menaquinone biosynthesis C-methylase UbiE
VPATEKPQSNEAHQLDLVRDRFTNTAKSFADFALTQRFAEAERLVEMLVSDAQDMAPWRALDLACGPGTFARSLARRVHFTVGLDLTQAMLICARQAVEPVKEAAAFVCADANRLPFAGGSFDAATCGYAIHHVMHPARILAELARVVRPGGRVAIVDIIVREENNREMNTRIEQARDPSHTETQRVDEFHALLEACGLRVRAKEIAESGRNFDHWMSVVNAAPGSAVYQRTRELMEATLADDAAGFHPRMNASGELEFAVTSLYIVAEKQ